MNEGGAEQTRTPEQEGIAALEAEVTDLREQLAAAEKRAEQAEWEALHDSLTGALNRRGTEEHFAQERRSDEQLETVAILFFDIDNFGRLNNIYGHAVGDEVLKDTVTILKQEVVRDTDAVSRWGGEELVVLMPGATEATALQRAEQIREKIKGQFSTVTHQNITCSIGVAELPLSVGDDQSSDMLVQLIAKGDKAMYYAKKNLGKDAIMAFSELPEDTPSETE